MFGSFECDLKASRDSEKLGWVNSLVARVWCCDFRMKRDGGLRECGKMKENGGGSSLQVRGGLEGKLCKSHDIISSIGAVEAIAHIAATDF